RSRAEPGRRAGCASGAGAWTCVPETRGGVLDCAQRPNGGIAATSRVGRGRARLAGGPLRSGSEAPAFVPAGYTIEHRLGSGQTSHVYMAKHRVFGDVALKLPRHELRAKPLLWQLLVHVVDIALSIPSSKTT